MVANTQKAKADRQAARAIAGKAANKSAMAQALEDANIATESDQDDSAIIPGANAPSIRGKGYIVKPLELEAQEEASEGHKVLQSRNARYLRIFKDHGTTDWPKVELYPDMVRKEYAKLMGFNMAVPVSDWTETDAKLYRVFVQHQVDPFQMFIDIANMKVKRIIGEDKSVTYQPDENGTRVGVGPVLDLLSNPKGSFASKVTQARLILQRPTRSRKKGATGNQASTLAAAATATGNTTTPAGTTANGLTADGAISSSKKWDLADLQKRSPREACTVLIGSMPFADCMGLVQAIAARMKQSDDGLDSLAGQELDKVYTMYLTKSDAPAKKVA